MRFHPLSCCRPLLVDEPCPFCLRERAFSHMRGHDQSAMHGRGVSATAFLGPVVEPIKRRYHTDTAGDAASLSSRHGPQVPRRERSGSAAHCHARQRRRVSNVRPLLRAVSRRGHPDGAVRQRHVQPRGPTCRSHATEPSRCSWTIPASFRHQDGVSALRRVGRCERAESAHGEPTGRRMADFQ